MTSEGFFGNCVQVFFAALQEDKRYIAFRLLRGWHGGYLCLLVTKRLQVMFQLPQFFYILNYASELILIETSSAIVHIYLDLESQMTLWQMTLWYDTLT